MKILTRVYLPTGHHDYKLYFLFYDDKGPIKDENNSYNANEYVGHIGELGEYDIPMNKRKAIVYSFFFPISELHRTGNRGTVQMFVHAKLKQDNTETIANHVRSFKINGSRIITNDI